MREERTWIAVRELDALRLENAQLRLTLKELQAVAQAAVLTNDNDLWLSLLRMWLEQHP